EARVGVALDRSFALIVSLLATWRAGAAYLPLDPTLPPERLAFMLEDARVPVLLTRRALAAALPAVGPRTLLVEEPPAAPPPVVAAPLPLQPENPAYVIYTSGSTGKPKGVVIAHGALANRLRFAEAVDLEEGERYIHKTTASFDPSIVEI